MTIKIRSCLPIVVAAMILCCDAAVYGDEGNLRGPISRDVERTESITQATMIHPTHTLLKNDTITPSNNNEGIKKEEQRQTPYVLRGSGVPYKSNNEQKDLSISDDGTKEKRAHKKQGEDERQAETFGSQKEMSVLENEILEIRRRIKRSQEQLQEKLQQPIVVIKSTNEGGENGNETETESELSAESESDGNCVYSFHKERDLHVDLKTTSLHKGGKCRLDVDIVQKSEIHARALIGDGACRFDSTHGHWYIAKCIVNDENESNGKKTKNREKFPEFVFTKAFCSSGCEICADPEESPDVHGHGHPVGPLFRTWGRPAFAICELPENMKFKRKRRRQGTTSNDVAEKLFVQYQGNCIQEICNDTQIST